MSSTAHYGGLILAVIALSLTTTACNPWRFTLQPRGAYEVEGRVLSMPDSVEIDAENAVVIRGKSKIAIRTRYLTDGVFTADVKLSHGTVLTLEFRSTPFDDSTKRHDGLILTIGRDEATVRIGNVVKSVPTEQTTDNPFRVSVKQHGTEVDIEVACTALGRFHTTTPATEWLMANTSDPGYALLIEPSFQTLTQVYFQE